MRTIHTRVAESWLTASRTLTAKAKYLKAIDFTIGLVRRLAAAGTPLPGMATPELVARLIDMREAAQRGVNIAALQDNIQTLRSYGEQVIRREIRVEASLLPRMDDYQAFVQNFPKVVDRAVELQARHMERIIAEALDIQPAAVASAVISDRSAFDRAFAACSPEISSRYNRIVSSMSGLGYLEHRLKTAKSCWGKQTREGTPTPFYRFKDLVGVRIVANTIPHMCTVARSVQDQFGILDKKNYYIRGDAYNAINYNLSEDWLVFEFQLKTNVNAAEAALSHDLIYAPEKAVTNLNAEERGLVELVVNVSTQLSMAEWNRAFGVPVRLARRR
jgi:ppGpp synthetase/RelA/SpoT-type nucleotidyltranferase